MVASHLVPARVDSRQQTADAPHLTVSWRILRVVSVTQSSARVRKPPSTPATHLPPTSAHQRSNRRAAEFHRVCACASRTAPACCWADGIVAMDVYVPGCTQRPAEGSPDGTEWSRQPVLRTAHNTSMAKHTGATFACDCCVVGWFCTALFTTPLPAPPPALSCFFEKQHDRSPPFFLPLSPAAPPLFCA